MKRVVFDVETDDLLEKLTRLWCLVIRDVDSDTVISCTDESPNYTSMAEGLRILSEAEVVYGHNSIGFDIPAIKKVHPNFVLKGKVRDTLVIAGMRWAHVKDDDFRVKPKGLPKKLYGSHSLEAWGHRLGVHKLGYEEWCKAQGIENPWGQWSPEMQTYCDGDTASTKALVLAIRNAGVSPESVETEQELREYLVNQEGNGWPFDKDKAVALQAQLSQKREIVTRELIDIFGSWDVPNGTMTSKVNNRKAGIEKGAQYTKLKLIEFNPGSRDHIADRLTKLYGWKPEVFTDGGSPKVDESTLKGLKYPPVPKLIEYLLLDKRLSQLAEGKEAWLKQMRQDSRTGLFHIYGRVKQNATITHRAAHSHPNVGQVPKVGKPYGAECRELYYVPPGWVQIGADASGLEARCLGHFVARFDGGAYAKLLLEGDVHTENRIALGLADSKEMRDRAKTWYYAWLFGAGDKKLGKILAPEADPKTWESIGKKKKKRFLDSSPALKYLIESVQIRGKRDGYIRGLDGRRVYIRSQHAALNTLIQSSGAIICKRWIVVAQRRLRERFGEQGWDGQWAALGWIHDELQIAVRPEIAQEVCAILTESIATLTDHFKFRCPLAGEAKTGGNWKDTH